jgi:leader peptidase (prepilin peptidase) / N-methyltransferase
VNAVFAAVLGSSGAVVGIAVASVAFGVAANSPIRLPRRWWAGAPARPAAIAATSTITGIAAAVPGAVLPANPALCAFWTFAVIGTGLAIIDIRQRRLPHLLTGAATIAAGLFFLTTAILGRALVDLLWAAVSGIVAAIILLAVALALPGQLGLGDVAFAGAATFTLGWLGWPAAAFGLVLGLGLQAVVGVALRRRDPGATHPLGPALLAGWVVAVAIFGSRS